MDVKLYCIFDSKSCVYDRPVSMSNDGEARRWFGDLCLDKKSVLGRHPEDFSLALVGQFNDNSGIIVPVVNIVTVVTGVEIVAEFVAKQQELFAGGDARFGMSADQLINGEDERSGDNA